MPIIVKLSEQDEQYLRDNYQDQSLAKMCEHLGIEVRIGRKALKRIGIVRTPELIGKFRGHKNQNEEWDNYFRENYLIQPLTHMCRHLGFSVKVGERMMERLGLVRPPELVLKFKSRHKATIDQPKPYKSRAKKKKKEKPVIQLKKDQPQKIEKVLPNKVVDYSTKIMVKIDNRTWVYRDKTA